MSADKSNKTRSVSIAVVLAGLCMVGLALVYGPHVVDRFFSRYIDLDDPRNALILEPLTDLAANPQHGMTLSQFGYEFEVPWKNVEKDDKLTHIRRITFRDGQVIVFFDPSQAPDLVKVMNDEVSKKGENLGVLFGSSVPTSNYELLRSVLSTTPQHVSLGVPIKYRVRNSLLLTLKRSELSSKPSRLYSIETLVFRGFQKGDPLHYDKAIILDLFDRQDHHLELWVVAQKEKPGKVSQADINQIVQTLRLANKNH